MRETQEKINQTLGRSFNTFIQTDFFGQGNDTPFMSLTPSAQKEVLETILPFDKINEWVVAAKKAKSKVTDCFRETEKDQISCKSRVDTLNNELFLAKRAKETWDVEKENKINNIGIAIEHLEKSEKLTQQRNVEKELEELEDASTLHRSLDKEYEVLALLKKNIENDRENFPEIIEERKYWEKEFNLVKSGKCPTCNQKVNQSRFSLEEIQQKLTKARAVISAYEAQISTLLRMKEQRESCISDTQNKLKKISSLNDKLAELREGSDQEELNKLKAQLTSIQEEKNPHDSRVEDLAYRLRIADNMNTSYENAIKEINTELSIVNFWEKAYSIDLRNILFDRVCPFLTDRTNNHLSKLQNSQIKVLFSTTKKLKSGDSKSDLSVEVESTTGGKNYSALSGGEKQMVNFAIGLALADLASTQVKGNSNLLILDEPFVGLDDRNSEAIVSYLQDLVKSEKKETVLLVSNESTLKNLIQRNIHVEKRNGITTVS